MKPPTPEDFSHIVARLQARLEAERARMAQWLHGDVAGMLAAARMELSRIPGEQADDVQFREYLLRIDRILEHVIADARAQMQRLHPALLDHFGLPTAVRHYVEEACRPVAAEYSLDLPESQSTLAPDAALAVFRVVETLLGERALRRVAVRMRATDAAHQLEIEVEGPQLPDAADRDEVPALRCWLASMGGEWRETQRDDVLAVEVRIPREAAPQAAFQAS